MCVIFAAETKPPSVEMIAAAFFMNDAGAGIASWEEGEVVWKKGLSEAEIQAEAASRPLPYVMHFRIPTVGGRYPSLCHPFPISEGVPLTLEGRTSGRVLFHNGHWTDWKQTLWNSLMKGHHTLPPGPWSDTRALAWVVQQYGDGVLDLIDEKVLILSPTDMNILGSGWSLVEDIWVSNKFWDCPAYRGRQWPQRNYYTDPPASLPPRDRSPVAALTGLVEPVDPVKRPGGDARESPLEKLERLHTTGRISRKQYKKFLRRFMDTQSPRPS